MANTVAPTNTVTPASNGVYTSEKLFLKLDTTEFNNHESDINTNGQIAFVDNGGSSFIYAQGIKVGGVDVNDLDLSSYATKTYVNNAINLLDATYAAQSGKYISAITQTNGKITSVTHADLPTVQTVSVNSTKNSITVGEIQYTLGISNGVLSLSKYAETNFNGDLTLSKISYTDNASKSESKYVGTTYSLSAGIDITSTSQTLTVPVINTTLNKYKIEVYDSNENSYIHTESSYNRMTNGNVEITIQQAYIMKDVQTQTSTGLPVTWNKSTPLEVNTTNERTFTVYLSESGKTPKSQSITQTNICSKATITAKVPILAIISSSTPTLLKDINYANTITISAINWTWQTKSNTVPTFYVPACLNKTVTIKDSNGFDVTSGFNKTTDSRTINGCKTSFNIYTMKTGKPSANTTHTIYFS